MNTTKRILLYFSVASLQLLLVLFATAAAIILPLSNPDGLKRQLADSSVYEEVSRSIVDTNVQAYASRVAGLDEVTVRAAGNEALTPDAVQGISEQIIDGTYSWLNGSTEQPEISIDLRPFQEAFAASLAGQAKSRLDSLPPCTAEQLRALSAADGNPFTIQCLPPGIDTQVQADLVASQVLSSNELQGTSISQETIFKPVDGQPFTATFGWLPQVFQLLMPLLWLTALLVILSAIGLITLSRDKRSGLRRVGKILLLTGVFTGIILAGYLFIFRQVNGLLTGSGEAQPVLFSILRVLTENFTQILLVCSAAYILLGLLLVLAFRKQVKNQEEQRSIV